MLSTILQYNLHREGLSLWEFTQRPEYLKKINGMINIMPITLLVWMRRVWKTTLTKMWVKEQVKQWEDPRKFCFISCDHYLLQTYTLFEIIDEVRWYLKLRTQDPLVMIFDEITYMLDYHQQLKNIADLWYTKVIALSSQSSVLHDQKAFLTWRTSTIEVFPLNFNEYLTFRWLDIWPADRHLRKEYFEEYMRDGGIPEYILTKNPEVIKEIVQDIINKDILIAHNVREKQVVKDLFLLLLERNGKQMSLTKIKNILWISIETLSRYMAYFEESYLFSQVQRDGKINERIRNAKKRYIADTWIKHVMTWWRDIWFAYETVCFNARRQKTKIIYYRYSSDTEIDRSINWKLYESKYGQALSDAQKKVPWVIILDWLDWYEKIWSMELL